MEWLAFLGSVIGGLIGGLFTFIGVRMTIKHDDKKKMLENIERANREKPRLEIISFKDFNDASNANQGNSDCNILALGILDFKDIDGRERFIYNEAALDDKNLVFVEYQFVNSGLTEIEDICVTSNLQRNMALIKFERKDIYINENLLNYDVWSDKRQIKPNDTFIMRIYYVKDQIPTTLFRTPELRVWLRDTNGRIWEQILNAPSKEIENSIMSDYKELRENRDIKKAIECFRHPELW